MWLFWYTVPRRLLTYLLIAVVDSYIDRLEEIRAARRASVPDADTDRLFLRVSSDAASTVSSQTLVDGNGGSFETADNAEQAKVKNSVLFTFHSVAARMLARLSVCLCVCLSRWRIVPKRLSQPSCDLSVCSVAVSDIAGRQRLRSAHRRQLDVACYRRTTLGCRAFSVAGIRFQASLEMRLKTLSGCHWKHRFSDNISVFSALEVFTTMCYINRRFEKWCHSPIDHNSHITSCNIFISGAT